MEGPFTYRNGVLEDLNSLQELGILCYEEYRTILSKEDWNSLYKNLINTESLHDLIIKSTVFVCEIQGTIIGVAYLVSSGNPTRIFQSDWCYLRKVGVHPSYRGLGIAKKLTVLCINGAKTRSELTLALHTSEIMQAARAMYESLGFKKVKEIDPIYGKRYWLYLLNLNCTTS